MTYTVDIYDIKGKKTSSKKLNKDLYGDDVINEDLIKEYFILQRANARVAIASTKTRGEVKGSGKKLYKQKGTGSARVGDKKSPIRRGGGVAFGPRRERNFSKTMNKKMRRNALRGLISLKAKSKDILGLEGFDFKEPKTKNAQAALSALDLTNTKVVVLIDGKNDIIAKSFSNLPKAKYLMASYCNPIDLLHAQKIICTEGVIEYLNNI